MMTMSHAALHFTAFDILPRLKPVGFLGKTQAGRRLPRFGLFPSEGPQCHHQGQVSGPPRLGLALPGGDPHGFTPLPDR